MTRYAGWQYIFYLNVPIGAVALLLAPRIVPESRLETVRRKFDAAGALAGTGGLVLLVDAISQAPQYGWGGTRTLGVLAAAAVLLAAFVLIERRVTDPILPLSIFRLRTLAGANTAGLLLGGSFYAFIFVGTLYMQQVLHYSALQTGLAWLAASLTSIALAGLSQALVTRGGTKIVMAAGMTMIGAGAIWASQVPVHGHFLANLAAPMVVAGAGTAFAFIPISIAALAGVKEQQAGLASGLLNNQLAARRRDRDRDRLERRRQPHPNAASRRPRRPRGTHRRVPTGALGARRDRPARNSGDLRARPQRSGLDPRGPDERPRPPTGARRHQLTTTQPKKEQPMRKLIESTLVSLDGVMGSPERWSPFDEESRQLAMDELEKYDAFVLGRVTYEMVREFWGPAPATPTSTGSTRCPNTSPPTAKHMRVTDDLRRFCDPPPLGGQHINQRRRHQ